MSIALQKQIKDNATDVSSYFTDLNNWTNEQGKREQRRTGRPTVNGGESGRTTAGAAAAKEPASSSKDRAGDTARETQTPEGSLALKRDGTGMSNYYHDWQRLDADKMVEQLDDKAFEEQRAEREARQAEKDSILDDLALRGDGDRSRTSKARPRVKISVRTSGRRVAPVDLAAPKKEEANRYLAEGRYREAIAVYTSALELLEKYELPTASDDGDRLDVQAGDCAGENTEALLLKVALFANRSLAFMKLEEWRDTATDCTEALRFDPTHHKAKLRRGFALARLKLWSRAVRDLQQAVTNDPNDKKASAELQMARRMLEEQGKEARAHAKRVMCDPTRNISMPTRKLVVRVQRAASSTTDETLHRRVEPPIPGATATATAEVLRAAAAEMDGEGKAAAAADASTCGGSAASGAVSADRRPYVPRSVRMRGRQSGQSAAMQAAVSAGSCTKPAGASSLASAPAAARGFSAMNFYTFEAQWARSRGRPSERIALLQRVGAEALPVLFRESLDAELLGSIVELLSAETDMAARDAAVFAASVLTALCRTPRFEMSLQCLSAEERLGCGALVERLQAAGAIDGDGAEELAALAAPPAPPRPGAGEDSDDAAQPSAHSVGPDAAGFSLDGCD